LSQQELPQTGHKRISKTECLAIITEPLTRGFGFRHLWIGYTGSGKTHNALALCDVSEGSHRHLIVTDQKNRVSPYLALGDITEIPHGTALDSVEPDARNHIQAIIRGPRLTNNEQDIINFDELGKQLWAISLQDQGVLLTIDELSDACEGERTWVKGESAKDKRIPYMKLLYTQGRTNRVSINACTQTIQELPRAASSNSDTLGIFCQDRKELPYYARNGILDAREIEIIEHLAQYEFLFIKRGMESAICRF
jgi:hypothetical protein